MGAAILQVVTDTDRRGAQVFASDLHRALEDDGSDVRTVALAPGTAGGLPLPTLGSTPRAMATLRALRREIAASDVIVAHGSTTLPACAIASFGTRVPFVYRQISDSMFWASTRTRRARVRLGLSRAAHVVALWAGAADTLHEQFGVARTRVSVIPNGVPVERFPIVDRSRAPEARCALGLEPDQHTVAYLGALVPEKGVDLAIQAIAGLPTVQLLVAGAGPQQTQLESLATTVAPGRVRFVGSLERSTQAFAAADVVVLPSRAGDSMPAVLIEAGLSGLPTISTAVEGIPEIVIDGVTGFLTPLDSAGALRDALDRLLADSDLASAMGTAARAHCVERFSIQRVGAQWKAVLEAVAQA